MHDDMIKTEKGQNLLAKLTHPADVYGAALSWPALRRMMKPKSLTLGRAISPVRMTSYSLPEG